MTTTTTDTTNTTGSSATARKETADSWLRSHRYLPVISDLFGTTWKNENEFCRSNDILVQATRDGAFSAKVVRVQVVHSEPCDNPKDAIGGAILALVEILKKEAEKL